MDYSINSYDTLDLFVLAIVITIIIKYKYRICIHAQETAWSLCLSYDTQNWKEVKNQQHKIVFQGKKKIFKIRLIRLLSGIEVFMEGKWVGMPLSRPK